MKHNLKTHKPIKSNKSPSINKVFIGSLLLRKAASVQGETISSRDDAEKGDLMQWQAYEILPTQTARVSPHIMGTQELTATPHRYEH